MQTIRILAVEDNAIHAAKLEQLISEIGYELIEVVSSVREAMNLFKATKPDIVLLDISLSEHTNTDGIELAKKINATHPVPIIFITASSDTQTFKTAKETEPYAYLIKPINKAELLSSIELAYDRFVQFNFSESSDGIRFTSWTQNKLANDAFFVKTINGLDKVRYRDILWITIKSDRYCNIVTEEKILTIRSSLKAIEEKLPPHQFIRSHRSYIVNIYKVETINEQELTLHIGEHSIPIGTSNKNAILSKLNIF